jgi:hypothetical protein
VARVHIGVRRRPDTNLPDPAIKITAQVSLKVNGTETTPVSAQLQADAEVISARAQNLDNPASDVSVVIRMDLADVLEVFEVKAECVLYQREAQRT